MQRFIGSFQEKNAVRALVVLLLLGGMVGLAQAQSPRVLEWSFPIKRPHAGPVMGNGKQGVMIWGEGQTLNLTYAQAGNWVYQTPAPRPSFSANQIQQALEQKNEQALKALFPQPENGQKLPPYAFQVGGGRLRLTLPRPWTLQAARLNLDEGLLTVLALSPKGQKAWIRLRHGRQESVLAVELHPVLSSGTEAELLPFSRIRPDLASQLPFSVQENRGAWGEKGLEIRQQQGRLHSLLRRVGGKVWLSSALDSNDSLSGWIDEALVSLPRNNPQEWQAFWNRVARLSLPDPLLQEHWDYALYKVACTVHPQGPALTLQGPLMEDTQLPPWANDYHFNVNVQMAYQGLLAIGAWEEFQTLPRMMEPWIPKMKQTGRSYFGTDGPLYLPHATDDRGEIISYRFWSGLTDAAALGWTAWLLDRYHQVSADTTGLGSVTRPLLQGAYEGYKALSVDLPSGLKGLKPLPSPEWKSTRIDALGPNATFQLACAQAVTRAWAQRAPGQTVPDTWAPYTVVSEERHPESPEWKQSRIGLWTDQDLKTSHRHHSHLAGLYPFRTWNAQDSTTKNLINNTLQHWVQLGRGGWTGWSYPWAASIWLQQGEPEAAVALLHEWAEVYTNEGRASLHDAKFRGLSTAFKTAHFRQDTSVKSAEIMQLDAGYGLLSTLTELAVRQEEGRLKVLPYVPQGWQNLDFDRVPVDGGFRISGRMRQGQLVQVQAQASVAGTLLWQSPWAEGEYIAYRWDSTGRKRTIAQPEAKGWVLQAGERLEVTRKGWEKARLVDFNPPKGRRREQYQGLWD